MFMLQNKDIFVVVVTILQFFFSLYNNLLIILNELHMCGVGRSFFLVINSFY